MKWSVRKMVIYSLGGLALLGILVFAVWRMRLANDVKSEFAAIHAAGLPTNGEEANSYYTKVPDTENAAKKIEEAFVLLTNYPDSRSNEVTAIKFPLQEKLLTSQQLELVAGYLAMNSNAVALARTAVKMLRSRYPIDLSLGAGTVLPNLSKLRGLSHIANFQACLNSNNSALGVGMILGMAHTLDNEPVLISKLVRIAMISEAVAICERRLNNGGASVDELVGLGKLFTASSNTNQMANAFIGERAMYIRYFRMSWEDIRKLSDNETSDSSDSAEWPASKSQPSFLKLTGLFERDLRFYLWAINTNIALAELFPKNVLTISNAQFQIEETGRRNYYILATLLMPAFGGAIFKEATGLAEVRLTQAALAVECFRLAKHHLPDNLKQLVPQFFPAVPEDPFNGQPVHFRLLEQGYLIYSGGKDGVDNGGRERPANVKFSDKTPYDITFTVER